MFKIGPFTLLWPAERRRLDGIETEILSLHQQLGISAGKFDRAKSEANRLADELSKAQGIYAGPLHGWTPADGTGFVIPAERAIGYRVTKRQDDNRGQRGLISLEAEVNVYDLDYTVMRDARHIEWEGIKWRPTSARSERTPGLYIDQGDIMRTSVSLEAFIEYKGLR